MRLQSARGLATLVLTGVLSGANAAEAVSPTAAGASSAASAAAEATDTSTRPQFRIRPVDDGWRASLPRDAEAATKAYLDRLPVDVVARSNDYFEGGYWLLLWNFLLGLAVALFLLAGRRAARMRDWAGRVGRKPFLRDALFGALYAVAAWALSLPLTIYQGYFREHQYAMATQSFGPWFTGAAHRPGGERRSCSRSSPPCSTPCCAGSAPAGGCGERSSPVAFLVLLVLVAPVVIDPLFNTYKPVADGAVKSAVLTMAHANGVPADNIYEFDASRQTTRVSATSAASSARRRFASTTTSCAARALPRSAP
jgi:STE24 endopeptidase